MSTPQQKISEFSTAVPTKTPEYYIVFGQPFNLNQFERFAQNCGAEELDIPHRWEIAGNSVMLFKGKFTPQILAAAHEEQLDAAAINFNARLSQAGLLVMDMDSTAIKIECIDEIAKLAGTGEEVSAITAAAMRGELDFEQSLRRRVATLKEAPESILNQVRSHLPLMEGLTSTLAELKKYGWKTAIASGGFTYFADHLKQTLGLDAAVSNQFEIIDGKLTGQLLGDIVHAQYKADTLQALAAAFNIPMENTVAIGDGANDLAMMSVANLGAAFHAKPKVQQQAQVVVNFADLTGLLCLLSANDHIAQLN